MATTKGRATLDRCTLPPVLHPIRIVITASLIDLLSDPSRVYMHCSLSSILFDELSELGSLIVDSAETLSITLTRAPLPMFTVDSVLYLSAFPSSI